MAEKVQLAAKTSKAKENSASTTLKIESPQSMSSPADQVLYLQRNIGNQAVQRLIKSRALQTKLKIGQPGDKYEQEADRVADAVMRMPEPGVQRQVEPEEEEELVQPKLAANKEYSIQRQEDEEEENEEKLIQTKPLVNQITPLIQRQAEEEEEKIQTQLEEEDESVQMKSLVQRQKINDEEEIQTKPESTTNPPVTSTLESGIGSLKGSGNPLSKSELTFFEPRFGTKFGNVKVHSNHNAATMAKSIQAKAFTIGSNIFFGQGQYTRGTSAGRWLLGHELVHVVQQNSHKKQGVIQRAPQKTYMGEFKDKVYQDNVISGKKYGVKIELEFHPGNKVNAKKIGMTQALKKLYGGTPMPHTPTLRNRMVKTGAEKGFYIDQISKYGGPLYATGPTSATDTLASTPTHSQWGHHGKRFVDSTGTEQKKEALIKDKTASNNQTPKSGQIFETTALALEGAQKGTYYGSVKWGWKRNAAGTFGRIPLTLVSKGTPSSNFMKAAKEWNKAKALGTIKTISDPTNVYQNNHTTVKFTVPKGTKVTLGSSFGAGDMEWMKSTIASGTKAGQQGLIKVTDLKDVGGGKATIDLPLTSKKFTKYPNVWLVRKPANYSTTRIAKLTKNSEVQVLAKGKKWWKITVVNSSIASHVGKVGWVLKKYLSDAKVK